ncbi:MAG TPA: hypothetical protein VFS21_37010 [Roseiflexaceae bacterium]|nr:hypothetical protein [Roseiflexaceae bacterium]
MAYTPSRTTRQQPRLEPVQTSNEGKELWGAVDGCPRLDAGVVLLPADVARLAAAAATVFCITPTQAAMQIRPFLSLLIVRGEERLLADAQREPLLATLRAAEGWARRRGEYVLTDGAEVRACASCAAQIAWITTETGTAMPLSVGTVELRGGKRFALTHYASCPDANEWRQHGRAAREPASRTNIAT